VTVTVAGAYGFRLSGLNTAERLAVTGASHWPQLSYTTDNRPDAAEVSLDVNSLELRVRADVSRSELVHPLLGRVGAQLALASRGDAMHAGAVTGDGRAWIVIGPKGAGKSTLLVGLAHAGVPVVTDDVVVLRDGLVTAGPRCIDLRPDAKGFGLGVAVRPSDPRNRIALPPIAAEHPLAGVIYLEWSPVETAFEPLDPGETIKRLLVLRSEKGYPRDPRMLLDLAGLPSLLLKRPRSRSGFDASVELMRVLLKDSADSRRTA
jgi:hypothetical protein